METDKIFVRKEELIKRDPVYRELAKTLNALIEKRRKSHNLLKRYLVRDSVFVKIRKYSSDPSTTEEVKKEHQGKYPIHWKITQLEAELAYKWRVNVRLDFASGEILVKPYINDEVLWVGSGPLIKGHEGVLISDFDKYPLLNWTPHPNPFDKKPILADINEFTTPGYNRTGQKYVPIIINVSKLNKSDARWVKKEIWKIVDSHLEKGQSKKPLFESKECAFLYHLRNENTFQNYVRWYDIHTEAKLAFPIGFRLIAFLERIRSENITAYEQWLTRLHTVKWKVGKDGARGEDRVEKGVKLIWEAIHREPYTPPKHVIEEWDCPEHGKGFSADCKHCKALNDAFERFYSMDRGYMPTLSDLSIPEDVMDALPYVRTGRIARKRMNHIKNHSED